MSNYNANHVNYFGGIPFNWDDRLYVKGATAVGTGTERPVGFTFDTMHFMYWNVRYFKYTIGGTVMKDMFSSFLAAGGASGGIAGATAGLAAASSGITSFSVSGKTRGSFLSRRFNRINDNKFALDKGQIDDYNFASSPNTPEAKQVLHRNVSSFKNKTINGKNVSVPLGFNEGSLPGGVVHSSYENNVMVYIDFSSIVYHRYLYYPIIMIQTPLGSSFIRRSSFSIVDGKTTYELRNGVVQSPFSYVSFYGGAPINMFVYNPDIFSQTYLNGSINIAQSKDCCSRFYYDGKDEERAEASKEDGACTDCERLGVGEKPPR